MRATTRITWLPLLLLLSLSFLFHSVCSNGDDQSATSVSKDAASVTPAIMVVPTDGSISGNVPSLAVTTGSKPTTGGATGAPPTDDAGKKTKPTEAPTPTKPTAAIITPAVAVTATSNPTVMPVPTKPQAPIVTDNPAAPPTSISGAVLTVVNDATPVAATPGQPKTMTPAATASSGDLVVLTNAATVWTPVASVPSKASGTEAPVRLPGDAVNVGTTKIPKVSTDAPTTGQQSSVHTTVTSKTSQEGSKGGTEKIAVTVRSNEQTVSGSLAPAGNTGTTSTPSTLTKAGPPAAETLATKAGTTSPQTTPTPTPSDNPTTTSSTTTTTTTITAAQLKTFLYSLNSGHEKEEEKDLAEVCRRLMANLYDGNCTLVWRHRNGKIQFDCVEINGKVKTSLATEYYEEITKKPTDSKTLIAILASCGALLIMIVILAVCASHHRKPYRENQQHLTEELHTVENGYHDNPTLEVMEVQPEMQEKKMALNGEFNDSWIVPIDNLLKEDIADEEDTHL